MKHSERIIRLAEQGISCMERALEKPDELIKDGKTDIKSLKEYANTMKTLSELVRELKKEEEQIQPIEVIMGEGEKYAN